jgi:hypothetical protein
VPTFEVVLRRPNVPDALRIKRHADAQVGDVVRIDGRPWIVVDKEPPLSPAGRERIICVPRKVQRLH